MEWRSLSAAADRAIAIHVIRHARPIE